MSLTDPIADMIARIKNGLMRSHKKIEMPASIFKTRILEVLKNEKCCAMLHGGAFNKRGELDRNKWI